MAGTELAKAYVQIIPSASGIKGRITEALGGEASQAGDKAGGLAGNNLVSKIKNIIAAAGIGKALQSALTEGANLQQSLGGIETLFKDSAGKVVANAKNAYKTAGMSANQYMETVTSFSASLLQGLSGDTNKAADVADMALTDMADNANKMGTSMELIQNAYQGFAKQNYTMLDNLKLGYGGTKTEMERLLADAGELTGVKYDINNLSDVYNAIHAIQQETGITGTTAAEASETYSGSLAAMKAAASDFLGNLALGEAMGPSLAALGETAYTFVVGNLIPMIGNIISGLGEVVFTTDWASVAMNLISSLKTELSAWAYSVLGTDGSVIDAITYAINTGFPKIVIHGVETINQLVSGILNNIPSVITSAGEICEKFVECITNNLPMFLESGIELVLELVNGIIKSLPEIVSSAVSLVGKLSSTIGTNAPKLIESGLTLIGKLAAGLIQAVPSLIGKIPGIISQIKQGFTSIDWGSVGRDVISGIARGISNGIGSIISAARTAAQKALNAAKNFLGIHSPSKVFEKEVGKMIDLGLAAGIENNVNEVSDSMKELSKLTIGAIDTDFSLKSTNISNTQSEKSSFELLQQLYVFLVDILPKMANLKVLLDTGVLVGELAPGMNVSLNEILELSER